MRFNGGRARAVCFLVILVKGAYAGVCNISNTADSGDGSLRQAVSDSNASGSANEIKWDSDSGGTISLSSDLESINGNTTLDVTDSEADVSITNDSIPLGGAVTFRNDNISTGWTISSIISGSGSMNKTGDGSLTLTGANTYGGGTVLTQGTLRINGDSALGDSAGGLTFNGGTLQILAGLTSARPVTLNAGGGTFDTNYHDLLLTGVIGGSGALTKEGDGTLTLQGANTYTGGTTVSSGTLSLGADMSLPTVGALVVSNDAAFDLGEYRQSLESYSAGGTTKMRLQTGVTNLSVTNNADLGGTLEVSLAPQVVAAGQTFTPITAGSVSGTFSEIDSPAALAFDPTYQAGAVQLTARLVPFAQSAETGNQRAVGNALEPLRSNPTGDMAAVVGNLYTLNSEELRSALDQIGPRSLATMRGLAVMESDGQSAVVGKRLAVLAGGNDDGGSGAVKIGPWGFFASGMLAASHVSEKAKAPEAAFHSGGFLTGVDWSGEHVALGILGGYFQGNSSLSSSTGTDTSSVGRGRVEKRSGRYGAYAAVFGGRFHSDLLVGAADDSYSTKREINFGEISRKATAETAGNEVNVHADASYRVIDGGWGVISPVLELSYDKFGTVAFTETGADSLNLTVLPQKDRSLRSGASVRYSGRHDMGSYSLGAYLSLGWRHEYVEQKPVRARLVSGEGETISVSGTDLGRDGFLTGLGVSFLWNERRMAANIEYSGDTGRLSSKQILSASIQTRF